MTSGPRVSRAGVADLARLAPLFHEYLRFYGRQPEPPAPQAFLHARLQATESVIFLAEIGDRAVGFVQLYPSFDSVDLGNIWILHDLYVAPDARRQGVARHLMTAARSLAEATGACGISLSTAVDNRTAQALYEQLGYIRDQRFHHYFLPLAPSDRV